MWLDFFLQWRIYSDYNEDTKVGKGVKGKVRIVKQLAEFTSNTKITKLGGAFLPFYFPFKRGMGWVRKNVI